MKPPSPPIATPRNGFQKYHDLKKSLTDFGLGVTVQFDSINVLIISRCKDKKENQ
jgi:hypothetical protein